MAQLIYGEAINQIICPMFADNAYLSLRNQVAKHI